MKANEIMIGDLLRVTKDVCIKKGTIVRVRAIDADDSLPDKSLKCAVRCQPIDDIYGMNIGGVWLNFLEPIPLTAEILEKNGFERDPESGWMIFVLDCGEISWLGTILNIRGDNTEYLNLVNCMFVHELQHALKLCRIDREIVL